MNIKSFTTLFLIFQVYTLSLFGQWVQQNSGTQYTLGSVNFPSSSTGYIVGGTSKNPFNGNPGTNVVYKTIDGGDSWNKIGENINPAYLRKTFFTNDNVGFAVGESGTILKTIDGGANWTIKNSTFHELMSVFFVDANNGFVVGEGGVIFKTTDAGDNWQTFNCNCGMGVGSYLWDVHFVNSSIGYAVGGQPKKIVKTTDGGNSWNVLTFPSLSSSLLAVYFFNPDTGFVSGLSEIYKTTDGGNNWTMVYDNMTNRLSAIHFPSLNIGYVTSDNGKIFNTTDGGNNWTLQNTNVPFNLTDIFMLDNFKGFATGTQGTILKTINGGLAVIENTIKNTIFIYPNPFSTQTVLQTDNQLRNATLTVYNCFGQTVKQIKNISGQTITVYRDNLPSGLYFLHLTQETKIITTDKLIISD